MDDDSSVIEYLGLDIGGANIKYACGNVAGSQPFELWKKPGDLSATLSQIGTKFPDARRVAITMTGELADCFASKTEGVSFIVENCSTAFAMQELLFYTSNGEFVDSENAIAGRLKIASANWHALATYSARLMNGGAGFLVDMGSTTVDLIPVNHGVVVSQCKTDLSRLKNNELVYCGANRTPIHSLIEEVDISIGKVPIAREFFATIGDALIATGLVADNEQDFLTADGRSATKNNSVRRLARMVCADVDELTATDIQTIANTALNAVKTLIQASVTKVVGNNGDIDHNFVISGAGSVVADLMSEIIATAIPGRPSIVSLADSIGPDAAIAGPAYSVAILAKEARNE